MALSDGSYWARSLRAGVSRRRFIAGTSLIAGSAAFLAACGGSNNANNNSAKPAASTQANATAAAGSATRAATAAVAAGGSPAAQAGVRGGTVRYYQVALDAGLDPAVYHQNNQEVVNLGYNQTMTYQVSKNLVAMDGMLKVENPDPMTWIWHVRPGMTFNNGDPITADDWAYSMNRVPVLQKERNGHAPVPYFNYIDFPVTAIDPATVQMKLKRPNGSTQIMLSRQYFAFINRKVAEAQPQDGSFPTKDVQGYPAGAGGGPYMVQKHDPTGTTLVRNPMYYKHPNPDDGFVVDGPYIDVIDSKILQDRASQVAAFLSGNLDMLGAVDPQEVSQFKGKSNLTIASIPNGAFSNISFDSAKFADPRARQAIRAAIDYDGYIASLLSGDGAFQAPVNTILPAFQGLSQADLKKYFTYDPAMAKQLWEAAGKPVSNIRLLTATSTASAATAGDFLKQSWAKALGLTTDIQVTDPSTWAQRANNHSGPKDWEILNTASTVAGGTSGLSEDSNLIWYDPRGGYASLTFNMSPDSDVPENKNEATQVAAMLTAEEQITDTNARKAKLLDLQKYILDNCYVSIPLPIASKAFLGYNNRFQDVPVNDWLNYYYYRRQSMWLKG